MRGARAGKQNTSGGMLRAPCVMASSYTAMYLQMKLKDPQRQRLGRDIVASARAPCRRLETRLEAFGFTS
ncbi:hypothetical protein AAFF_G00184400 [Aldrovandia affinis]|uniref:Uncharacterized protein n=1 Tax=Aldrovandia affinis TaxID=143900 RepID=A0AAD7RK17_9TELE|nr:hypothetical protein AAFF_G00184400 [Aldrovandia affinis]